MAGTLIVDKDTERFYESSSTKEYNLISGGDTFRLVQSRSIKDPNEKGVPGEICWDHNGLYVCVEEKEGVNVWRLIKFS
jgi:hypothetical protein